MIADSIQVGHSKSSIAKMKALKLSHNSNKTNNTNQISRYLKYLDIWIFKSNIHCCSPHNVPIP